MRVQHSTTLPPLLHVLLFDGYIPASKRDFCGKMWDPEDLVVYLRGKVAVAAERNKNPIKMTHLKEYIFTFEEGGWNTVWAKSLPGARKEAVAEYKDSPTLTVRLDSVYRANKGVLESAMSTFY